MTNTRPDICYAVTKLSQFMSNPSKAQFNLAKNVLRYLKGTIDRKLSFTRSHEHAAVVGFCDSDWGTSEDRRSISGYCFQLSSEGPLISWKSKKQPTVALSTCESEYMATTYAIQEGMCLRQLLSDMTGNYVQSFKLFNDNQGSISLCKNPVNHQRSKHIDIRYHFIREHVQSKVVNLDYVQSDCNVADIFTKPVSQEKLKKFQLIFGNFSS